MLIIKKKKRENTGVRALSTFWITILSSEMEFLSRKYTSPSDTPRRCVECERPSEGGGQGETEGYYFALVIRTRTLPRASFSFLTYGVYAVVETAPPRVYRTRVCPVLHTCVMTHQKWILFYEKTADPWAKPENSKELR